MERGSNHSPNYASGPTTLGVHRRGRWLRLWGYMGETLVPVHVAFSLSGSGNRHPGTSTHCHGVYDLGPMVAQQQGGGPL